MQMFRLIRNKEIHFRTPSSLDQKKLSCRKPINTINPQQTTLDISTQFSGKSMEKEIVLQYEKKYLFQISLNGFQLN
jgi:hypothetical protein